MSFYIEGAEADEKTLDAVLAAVMRKKLARLAKAQALAWNGLSGDAQRAYLDAVDRLGVKQ